MALKVILGTNGMNVTETVPVLGDTVLFTAHKNNVVARAKLARINVPAAALPPGTQVVKHGSIEFESEGKCFVVSMAELTAFTGASLTAALDNSDIQTCMDLFYAWQEA